MNPIKRPSVPPDPKSCLWCGSERVRSAVTNFGIGIGSGSIPKARRGTYFVCDTCGVVFTTGDTPIEVDGELYLVHQPHAGADQLAGRLVTGPWGKPVAPGTSNPERPVLMCDDVEHALADNPLDHLDAIVPAVRAKRAT